MRKTLGTLVATGMLAALILSVNTVAYADSTSACTTIPEGTLVYPAGRYLAGEPLQAGFDAFGYNYQAHLFKGSYANVYLNGDGLPPYGGDAASYLSSNP